MDPNIMVAANITKGLNKKSKYVDNWTFWLHYRVTVIILIVCSLLNMAYQNLGTPIKCIGTGIPRGKLKLLFL